MPTPKTRSTRRPRVGRRLLLALALLPLALVAASGCASLRALAVGLERPTLAYESWSAEALDVEGVTIALHYRLENPNDFGLDLRRLGYQLDVEGSRVATGELPNGLKIAAKGASPLVVPVRLRWKDLPGFGQLLVTRKDVAYRIAGDVGVGSALGTIDLPFEHTDRVALPRLPSIRLEGVRLGEASLSNLALDLRLRISNGNAFPLPVGALSYGLRVGQRDLVEGASHPLAAVPPRGEATVTLPVRVSAAGAAESVAALLRGAGVRLQGLAGFGAMQVPIDATGEARGGRP